MFRIDNASSVASLPTPATAGTEGYFTGGNPGTGTPPTILPADWLNMVQAELENIVLAASLTPSKTTYNQVLTAIQSLIASGIVTNVYTGGTTTGSANAQAVATVSPSASSFANGKVVICTAGYTNTGSATFSAGGETAVTIKKDSGSGLVNLVGGEIVTGDAVILVKNTGSSCWVLTSGFPLGAAAYLNIGANLVNDGSGNLALAYKPISSFKNLKILTTSGTSSTITADLITVTDSNGLTYTKSSFSQSYATGTSGAGGLDTGSIANNTWYYEYAIYNPTSVTWAALISLSATSPTLPSGYTAFARVGAIRYGSGTLLYKTQYGRDAQYIIGTSPSSGVGLATGSSGNVTTPTYTAVSISSAVPPTAAKIRVSLETQGGIAILNPNGNYGNDVSAGSQMTVSGTNTNIVSDMTLESTNIYYAGNASACAATCWGWTDNL
jgi:hypothetical protein